VLRRSTAPQQLIPVPQKHHKFLKAQRLNGRTQGIDKTNGQNSKRQEFEGEPEESPARIVAKAEIATPPWLHRVELTGTGSPAAAAPDTPHIFEQVRILENKKRIIRLLYTKYALDQWNAPGSL
jgi:hypothetical protein